MLPRCSHAGQEQTQLKGIPKLLEPGIYSDGGGLYLRVRKTGTRSWLCICMINGKRREMGLGTILDVSLNKALSFDQLPEFIVELRNRSTIVARALEFAILTAARTGEIMGATCSEVNVERKLWTIPGDRMKGGQTHAVPPSDPVISLLQRIEKEGASADRINFAGPRGGSLSNMAIAQLLKRMDCDATVRGFRSTFRDWAGETTTFAREDIEMALAHAVESKTERAYRRGTALEKRRQLMSAFAIFSRHKDHSKVLWSQLNR